MIYQTDFPVDASKIIVIISSAPSGTGNFNTWYREQHAGAVLSCPSVTSYRANPVIPGFDAGIAARTNNTPAPFDIAAIDEIKGADWKELSACYEGLSLVGAYAVNEYTIRELITDRPKGMEQPELKRFCMLTKPNNKTHDEAMEYWIHFHPEKCFRHHSGMAAYYQNHIEQYLTKDSLRIDGFPELYYWNEDALKFGHFSQKNSKDIINTDCTHFRSTSFVITTHEIIMK